MITTNPHTTFEETLVHSASAQKRRMCFVIWNFVPVDMNVFMRTVDAAKEKGFTTIRLHLSWFNAEKHPLRYDFRIYDRQIAYIVSKGMDIILTVDLQRKAHTFDGERVPTDMVLNTDEFQYSRTTNSPYTGSAHDTVMISFASRKGTDYAVRFYRDTVKHFVDRFGNAIAAVFPTFTPFCETEYWCAGEYDYSAHMRRAFTAYLTKTYRKVQYLNRDIGGDYADFADVPMPEIRDRSPLGVLFYQCRHNVLKAFIDRLAAAHKSAAPDTMFAVQFGSVWDSASILRCTYGAAALSEAADLVVVDDAPGYDHAFSMDYLASMLSGTGKRFGCEIDGYYLMENGTCTAEDYIEQGITCFRHNAAVLYAANWQEGEAFDNNGYIFSTIADEYLTAKSPFCVSEDYEEQQPLDVSLFKLFETGDGEYYQGYYNLYSDNGDQFCRINVHDDLTTKWYPNSVQGRKAKKEHLPKDPSSPAVIFRRKAKAAITATAALGAAIVILSAGAAAKIIMSDRKTTSR